MKSKQLKAGFILCLITLISGSLLSSVYSLTKEPIAESERQKLNEAYQAVLNQADSFKANKQTKVVVKNYKKILKKSKKDFGKNGVELKDLKIAYKGKDVIGYVVNITTKDGYGGDINIIVGVTTDQSVSGIEILSISESPGLGMNAKNDEFLNQYKMKKVNEFVVVKDKKTKDNEIDAISSATITSKAVTNAVNASLLVASEVNAHE